MTSRTRRIAPALLAAMILIGAPALTACGQAAQDLVENAAGNAVGGDVNLNSGQLTVKNSNGDTVALGTDVNLPDTWPSAVPVPDNSTLISVATQASDQSANAIWTVDGSPEDAGAAYDAQLTSAGFTKSSDMSAAGMTGGEYTGNDLKVTLLVIGAEGKTSITVTVQPASS